MTQGSLLPASVDTFEAFWARYPKKVARKYAEKCYRKALKEATHETIMAGLDRYIASKPAWQAWAHPSSWLNADRWADEHEEPRKTDARDAYLAWVEAGGCRHMPRCGNYTTCQIVSMRQSKAS